MKSLISPDRLFGIIEPLEGRIAPTVFVTGIPDAFPNANRDLNYTPSASNPAADFVNTELGTDAISLAVGGGVLGKADTFYLKLKAGDTLQVFNQGGNSAEDYLIITKGNVVAFFEDKDRNNEVDQGELVSLSLGKNAKIRLRAGLDGDIITNLDEKGTRGDPSDDSLSFGGLVSAKQNIKGVDVGGGVKGKILAGGNIKNVTVTGAVGAILAGTGAIGATFDMFPGIAVGEKVVNGQTEKVINGGQGIIAFDQPAGRAGASIKSVTVDEVVSIQAGNGGLSAAGGLLDFIQITEDHDGMKLGAGNGGGTDADHKKGGNGGSVTRVYVSGVVDATPNDLIDIHGGAGGTSSVFGKGGNGGKAAKVFVGYQLVGTSEFQSSTLLQDNVLIAGGVGGAGKAGGKGGKVAKTNVVVNTPDGIQVTEVVQGSDLIPSQEVQSFVIDPTSPFTVSYSIDTDGNGVLDSTATTASLPPTTTSAQLQTALNALSTITADDGVTVTLDAANNKYFVRFVDTTDHPSLSVASNARDEIRIIGGAGGDNTVGDRGKTGAGGSLSTLRIENRAPIAVQPLPLKNDPTLTDAERAAIDPTEFRNFNLTGAGILLDAGDAGKSAGVAAGTTGGSITGVTLLGISMKVLAGDGSIGSTGGQGGALADIQVIDAANVLARYATFSSGVGGIGLGANGGAGGDVSGLAIRNGDFRTLNIVAADGGNSGNGRGGAGGRVLDLDVFEGRIDSRPANLQDSDKLNLRSGEGGDGVFGGGAGGAMKGVLVKDSVTGVELVRGIKLVSLDMQVDVRAGSGGDGTNFATPAVLSRTGGAGGKIATLEVLAEGKFGSTAVSANIHGGVGGGGKTGGVGGKIAAASVRVDGDGSLVAGNGGNGSSKASGVGASIRSSGLFAGGKGELIAGTAGQGGTNPGAGGSVLGTAEAPTGLYATTDLKIQAGDGTHGGAGGSIIFVGYGSTEADLLPTPRGNIIVQAGNGSGGNGVSGVGGSISNLSGSISTPLSTVAGSAVTRILAGNGGSSATTSSAGGSITTLVLERGGNAGVELIVRAGDAGDSPRTDVLPGAKLGANGGKVDDVSVTFADDDPIREAIAKQTIFRSVAAGDGGDAAKFGGAGGSVTNVRVFKHEIGVRSGEAFGYDHMGGIFAGAGGGGLKAIGKAGNVLNINADAIASIVAGKTKIPQSAKKVDFININELGNLLKDSTGALQRTFPGAAVQYNFNGQPILFFVDPTTTAADLQTQFNLVPEIITAGLVDVTGSPATGFTVTFRTNGNQPQITGEESFFITPQEVVPGDFTIEVTEVQQGDNAPPTFEVQSFTIDPNADFTITYTVDFNRNGFIDTSENIDLDGDGIAYRGEGIDFNGNGVIDLNEGSDLDGDGFITPPEGIDLDGNGVIDRTENIDVDGDGFVYPGEGIDANGDRIIDLNEGRDFDGDGFITPTEGFDFNGNGVIDPTETATTRQLPPTTTAAELEAALNALMSIDSDGPPASVGDLNPKNVSVVKVGDQFTIQFAKPADHPSLIVSGQRVEKQRLDVFETGSFTIGFTNQTTFDFSETPKLPFNASAATVQTELNKLLSIQELLQDNNGNNIGAVTVTQRPNAGFDITFNNVRGDQFALDVQQFVDIGAALVTDGTPTVREIQKLTLPPTLIFVAEKVAAGAFVGGIEDVQALNGPNFRYLDASGVEHNDGNYDYKIHTPVDGLIIAKKLPQDHLNFTPEARVVNGVFYDFNNLI